MHWTPGRTAAGLAATVSIVGLAPGAAHGAADIKATLSYQCATASGLQKATVRISGNAPATGIPGKPLRIGPVTVTVTGGEGTTGLLERTTGGGQAGGIITLSVTAGQAGGDHVDAQWPPLLVTSADPAAVSATGQVPSVTTAAGGAVTWRVRDLVITPVGSGRPVKCTADKEGVLATVPVRGAAGAPPGTAGNPAASDRARRAATGPVRLVEDLPPCDPKPEWTWNPDPDLQMPDPPPGSTPNSETAYDPACGRLALTANILKADAATLTEGMASLHYSAGTWMHSDLNYLRIDNFGTVAVRPATATTLGFGFLPTAATSEIRQEGLANISGITSPPGSPGGPGPDRAIAKSKANLRVTEIKANGVTVPVGARCGTATPVNLTVHRDLGRQSIYDPGLYTGTATIPRFARCGVGEDISPLLTASVSGPGNTVEVNQSGLCFLGHNDGRPCVPGPIANTAWTVKPGGTITATATGVTIGDIDTTSMITCATSKITMDADLSHRQGRIAAITDFSFDGCTDLDGVPYEVSVLPYRDRRFSGTRYDPATGSALLNTKMRLRIKGADGCTADIGNGAAPPHERVQNLNAVYDNQTRTLHMLDFSNFVSMWVNSSSGCSGWQRQSAGTAGILIGLNILDYTETGIYTLDPEQTITGPTP
ncbi:hypothetical protein [Actinomadura sp. 9N407]|uniref:hypothetical protein n=1 Tax=Actinomadura sp. 9N407 TaxID=3375154 RepID=UPI003798CAAB